MLKEILEGFDKSTEGEFENLALEMLWFVEQTHLYHLFTSSYSEHVALGEFYEDIQGDVDTLIETYLGMGFTISSGEVNVNFKIGYKKEELIKQLSGLRTKVSFMLDKTSSGDLLSLNGVLEDIQGDIDTLSYKLSME